MKQILLSPGLITFYAIVIGAITGFFSLEPLVSIADIIAEVAIKLMKLLATPLLFLSIVSSVAHFKNFNEIKILGWRIFKYTFFTTFIATLVAEAIYYICAPWLLSERLLTEQNVNAVKPGFLSAFIEMIPDNFLGAFISNNILAIVIMALVLAVALLSLKEKEKEIVFLFFTGLQNALMRIIHYLIKFMPVIVFAFITKLFLQVSINYDKSLIAILGLTISVIAANIIQGVIILPLFLYFNGIKPWDLLQKVKGALALAFFTRSSVATLPVSLDLAIQKAKIRPSIAKLSLPLCTTINMNGCAQFILLAVYFVAAHTGNALSLSEHFSMIFIAVLAAVGNAGIPMGCFFLASSILASKEIPFYLMGSILPFYTLIDMVETALNVWSDLCVTKVVDSKNNG